MKDYKKLSLSEAVQRLCEIENPLVLMHARPDGDTVGSGIALCKIFRALGKNPVYLSEDKIPKRLEFLTKGETLATDSEGREIVAVDIASPSQAGKILDTLPDVSLMIDHHELGKPFADYYTIPKLSSAGEAVLNLALELDRLGKIKLTQEIAYPLYAAMSSDTACFRYSSANDETYKKAAILINTGIDFSDINHKLFNSKSPEQIKAEGFTSVKMETAECGKIAYATISLNERLELGIPFEFFETAIDVVRSLTGVEIAFVVKETDAGEYRVSLRSTGYNVAEVAAIFGGGGHARAAGCAVMADSIDKVPEIILNNIYFQEGETK